MEIQAVNNLNIGQNSQPQFKKAYPVYHWVTEKGGQSYAPAVSHELNKKLQGIIVRLFNRTSKLSTTEFGEQIIKKLKPRIEDGVGDSDYALAPIVRTFNNKKGGWKERFVPINYIISGNDVNLFDAKYGKPIGKTSVIAPKIDGVPSSAEYISALKNYELCGLKFVKTPERKIVDNNGMEYGLHTKFEVVRNKYGKIKGYQLIDIKFCPETGSENPFVRTRYYEK